MEAIVLGESPYKPALKNSKGEVRTAPFTTFNEELARHYAEFAAGRNTHDDPEAIQWPQRHDPMNY
jgi:hypothetical protein